MGTALFAVEVLFRRDIAVEALIPAIIASVIAYAVTLPFWGYGEVFPRVSVEARLLYTADALVAYLGLAVVSAGFGLAYVRMFHGARRVFERLIGRRWLRPVAGAAVTGAIGLVAPCVLGSGRQLLTRFLEDPSMLLSGLQGSSGLAALVLVAVALAKMIATSMSIGSGGSGGVFAPGVMAGATGSNSPVAPSNANWSRLGRRAASRGVFPPGPGRSPRPSKTRKTIRESVCMLRVSYAFSSCSQPMLHLQESHCSPEPRRWFVRALVR